jgi:hypothetical protein
MKMKKGHILVCPSLRGPAPIGAGPRNDGFKVNKENWLKVGSLVGGGELTMKKKMSFLAVALLFWAWTAGLKAENRGTATPSPAPAGEEADSPGAQGADGKPSLSGKAANPEGEEEEPFVPHWTGEVGYTFTTQPSSSGPGQVSQEISLTGNYAFSESGNYFSLVAGGGQQTLEGANNSYGTFSGGLGLGFGVFQPSLSVAFEQGAEALNSLDASLTLNFQFFKPLALGLILEASPQSHQGALSTVLGGNSDQIDEIDSVDLTGGLEATFTPWDFLTLTLTGEQDDSTTYQWQNILHTSVHALNQTEQIPSATLGADITFLQDFTLDLSIQEGEEIIPAGVSYNPVLKKTQDFSSATTQSFSGYTVGLTYNL